MESRTPDTAIVGMACLFPQAPDLQSYWRNIISKKDAMTDPAPSGDVYAMYDPRAADDVHVYCKRGGYLDKLACFEPSAFGVTPQAINAGDPDQWLALKTCRDALNDAGYGDLIPERNQTAVVLGKSNYLNRGNTGILQRGVFVEQMLRMLRCLHPEYTENELDRIRRTLKQELPDFDAETAPALIPNLTAGRIAHHLNLTGPAYTVDAGCASSLVALDIAAQYLASEQCDLAVAGGVHLAAQLQIRQVLCRLGALSAAECIRPFDAKSDGTLIGEGVGMMVLKRLSDALQDGNRIYAVVRGVGIAGNGRAGTITAPHLEGEILALERVYKKTRIEPRSIGLIEAHGTGRPEDDAAEIAALMHVLGKRAGPLPSCAIGSVKSMVGHLMAASGAAGLIKAALALHHKVLPPTLNVTEPLPEFRSPDCALALNTETRPWVHGGESGPRRAAVNAFDFGGINAHAILEEAPAGGTSRGNPLYCAWDSELFVFSAADRAGLCSAMHRLLGFLARDGIDLKNLAFTLNVRTKGGDHRLAVIASSQEDLRAKLQKALARLSEVSCRQIRDPQGVYYFEQRLAQDGKLAFVFPGEGSQYPHMLSDLCMSFPEVMRHFELFDRIYARVGSDILPSDFIFAGSGWSEKDAALVKQRLWSMDGAVSAILTANAAVFELLTSLGIRPDCVLGHSTGEFSAMMASRILDLDSLQKKEQFGEELLRLYTSNSKQADIEVALAAVGTDSQTVEEVLRRTGGFALIAMDNCPLQTVISGDPDSIDRAVRELQSHGVICERLAFNRPYHTPAFSSFSESLRTLFSRWIVNPPAVPTYSCAIKSCFPSDLEEIRNVAVEQWVRPVAFRETVEAMYANGVRVFIEVGARGNLCSFILNTLRGRPLLAIPAAPENKSSITALHHLLGILSAQGLHLDLGLLYSKRNPQELQLNNGSPPTPRLSNPVPVSFDGPTVQIPPETAMQLRHQPAAPVPATSSKAPQRVEKQIGHLRMAEANGLSMPDQPVPAASSRGAAVMRTHLRTMEEFLNVQQTLVQSYLSKGESAGNGGSRPAGAALIREGTETNPPVNNPGLSKQPLEPYLSNVREICGVQLTRFDSNLFPKGISSSAGGIEERTLADSVLSRSEQEFWKSTNFSELRRMEWLCGRIAAKDAVRRYVSRHDGLTLRPADIEIWPDEKGRPTVSGAWTSRVQVVPAVSISHSGGFAAAAAVHGYERVGIDIEPAARLSRLKQEDHQFLFGQDELSILTAVSLHQDPVWRLRAWCAKEAAAKTLGRGLGSGLLSLQIKSVDAISGTFVIHSAENAFPLKVRTAVDQELVVAACVQRQER